MVSLLVARSSTLKLYLIGSLRNPEVPLIGNRLRDVGFDVFDDWFGGGPEADDKWKEYEQIKGRTYFDALYDRYATHIWEFDKHHLDTSDGCVMVHPVGRSAHIELGYMIGLGKPSYVYFPAPEMTNGDRWDVMYRFCTQVFVDIDDLVDELKIRWF